MSAQRNLFPPGPATGNLTAKQQLVLDHLTTNGPQRQIDIGHHLHLERGCPVCLPHRTCQFARRDAGTILDTLRAPTGANPRGRGLVIRKQTGLWQLLHSPRVPDDPDVDPFPIGY